VEEQELVQGWGEAEIAERAVSMRLKKVFEIVLMLKTEKF